MANPLLNALTEIPTELGDIVHEIAGTESQEDANGQQESIQSDSTSGDVKPESLMYYYYSEWEHREETFWKMSLQLFLVGLVVNLAPFTNVDLIDINSLLPALPVWLPPLSGLLIAQVFLVVSKGFAARLKAADQAYQRLIGDLPARYQRPSIHAFNHGLSSSRLSYLMTLVMYLALMAISIPALVICLSS